MIEKQNLLHQHADCLEQLLENLAETNLQDICPYSELLKLTPLKDEFLSFTPNTPQNNNESVSNGPRPSNQLPLKSLAGQEKEEQGPDQKSWPRQRRFPLKQDFEQNKDSIQVTLNRKQAEQLQKLYDYVDQVRNLKENAPYTGSDMESRCVERAVKNVPTYEAHDRAYVNSPEAKLKSGRNAFISESDRKRNSAL